MKHLVIFSACLAPGALLAQCPGGTCPAPAARQVHSAQHGWYDGGNGALEFYWRGERVGALDPRTATWQTAGKPHTVDLIRAFNLDLKAPRPAAACPCPDGCCPCIDCACGEKTAIAAQAGAPRNFGVDWSHMRKDGRESFRIAGEEVSRGQAFAALAAGGDKVPDDGQTPRLVVLGSAGGRRKVLDDWSAAPALAAWKDKAILQAYPPDHWHVAEVGYKQFGDPTLYLVDAKGKVVTRQTDYDGGPERLAKTLSEGLRVADPTFDPSKAPDLSRPQPPAPAPGPAAINANQAGVGVLAAVAAGVGVLFYRKKRHS